MNILRAELSRLRYRRRTMLSLVAVLLMGVGMPMLWMDSARPLSELEYAEADAAFASVQDCLDCQASDFLRYVWGFDDVINLGISPFVTLLAVIVLVVAMLFVGSDFQSGAVATQLTFTPRRSSLVVARATVAGLLGAALMAIGVVSSTVVSAVWFIALNGFEELEATPGLLALVGAAVLYGWFLGVIGALVTILANGTTGAVAILVAAVIVNLILLIMGTWTTPTWIWHVLPTQQGEAMVTGASDLLGPDGQSFEAIARGEAVVYHAVVVALLAAVTLPVFERRDVKN